MAKRRAAWVGVMPVVRRHAPAQFAIWPCWVEPRTCVHMSGGFSVRCGAAHSYHASDDAVSKMRMRMAGVSARAYSIQCVCATVARFTYFERPA